ncbi:AraC family transcriptional regulator [Marinibacterium profundimaris]|uniref:AraC family transcriptional regulator n=1 Tax=Marinibacterium profundimaris TaxID=1679460 RepID=UPI001303A4FD|nr:AraC family transcriptional regulator [Marinibacterium profundimaris]
MTVEKAFVNAVCVGRVRSTGHDIRVIEERKISVIIPTVGTITSELSDRTLHARPGQLLIVGRGIRSTRVMPTTPGTYDAIVLLFDQSDLTGMQGKSGAGGRQLTPDTFFQVINETAAPTARHFLQLAQMLTEDLDPLAQRPLRPESQVHWQDILSDKLLTLMQPDALPAASGWADRPAHRHVRKALEFMHAAYEDIGTISDIAVACGISNRTLETAFRAVAGRSPWAMLTDIRLEQARKLLLSDDIEMTVASAAYAAGFGHLGRFAKAYATKYGEAPSATLARQRY